LYESSVRQLNVGTNLRLSRTLLSYLESKNDLDRLNALFTPGSTGHFGLMQGDFNALTSVIPTTRVSSVKMSPTDPFYFFSTDEVNFMLAEAALRVNAAESVVKGFYDKAVADNFKKLGLTVNPTALATGGALAFPVGGTNEQKLSTILMQKWVAMVKQGYESYFDQARTGIPKVSAVRSDNAAYVPGEWTYAINAVTTNSLPKRLPYPAASADVNTNTPTRVPITTKVWWMK
jgi:hypothetical protein